MVICMLAYLYHTVRVGYLALQSEGCDGTPGGCFAGHCGDRSATDQTATSRCRCWDTGVQSTWCVSFLNIC